MAKSAAADKPKPANLQLWVFFLYDEKTFCDYGTFCSVFISSIFGTVNVTILKCFRG